MNGDGQNEGLRLALDLELVQQRALSAIGALESQGTGQGGGDGGRLRSSVEEVPVLEVDEKVKADEDDETPGYLDEKVQYSLEVDAEEHKMQLVGDADAPGNTKYYGTNGSGTKGFYPLEDEKVKADEDDETPGYLDEKVRYSLEVNAAADKMQLVGDEDAPGNTQYYGTNESGDKGFYSLADVIDAVMLALGTSMTAPGWVLGRKSDGEGGFTYGWVATVTHASQHPES